VCGCFSILLGAFFPRIALVLIWLFTDVIFRAFSGEWILPLAGIVLLPYTTLAYVLVFWATGEVVGIGWAFVILGLVFDIGSYTSGWGQARSQQGAQA